MWDRYLYYKYEKENDKRPNFKEILLRFKSNNRTELSNIKIKSKWNILNYY